MPSLSVGASVREGRDGWPGALYEAVGLSIWTWEPPDSGSTVTMHPEPLPPLPPAACAEPMWALEGREAMPGTGMGLSRIKAASPS